MNTYGFGADHDPKLMSAVAKMKNGGFFFIKDINNIAEYFILSMGGLLSIITE